MIRLLTFTNLYPSVERPRHGVFVEQRLRRLVATGRVSASVVVPVVRRPLQRNGAAFASTVRHGIPVSYVRFPAVRGLTSWINPLSMALYARRTVERHAAQFGPVDIVDAQFFYPDGVAGALLASWIGRPVVITARGSDINVAATELVSGACIRWAAKRSAAVIAVSNALRDSMAEKVIPADAVTVIRNGVDLDTFRPLGRQAIRARLGLAGPTLLSVGNLVVEKGHDLAISALARLPAARLIIIGSGPLEHRLRRLSETQGVSDRVSWIAPLPQVELAHYYAAADICLLASSREGMPNVLLECLACGTPVVATAVGGSVEIVASPDAGILVSERSADALASACADLLRAPLDRAATRRHAERFGWAEPIMRQLELLERVAADHRT